MGRQAGILGPRYLAVNSGQLFNLSLSFFINEMCVLALCQTAWGCFGTVYEAKPRAGAP